MFAALPLLTENDFVHCDVSEKVIVNHWNVSPTNRAIKLHQVDCE